MKILFQGDSITDGNWGRNGDLNHIMGHGYAFSIATRLGFDYPGTFEFVNRGVSANDTNKLRQRWQTDTLDLKPDLVSLLVGTNDTNTQTPPEQYEANLRYFLDSLPRATFVLCEPFRFQGRSTPEEWEVKSRLITQYRQIVRQVAQESGSIFVPLYDPICELFKLAPETYWIWDGVHPTVAGHELITRQWLTLTRTRLEQALPKNDTSVLFPN